MSESTRAKSDDDIYGEDVDYDVAMAKLNEQLRTSPPKRQEVNLELADELVISGDDGTTMAIPPGKQRIWLEFTSIPDGDEEYPSFNLDIGLVGSSEQVRQERDLRTVIDFTTISEASWWKDIPEDWQTSFSKNALLPPTGYTDDARDSYEFAVGNEQVSFYAHYTPLGATLACPEQGGPVWCRIHGLYHEDEESGEFIIEPPFCFPLPTPAVLGCQSESDENEDEDE